MYDFVKTMGILRGIYDEDKHSLPNIFWTTLDRLPNDQLYNWVERMLSNKNLLMGNDYLVVVSINFQYRQNQSYSVKQKRRIAMHLVEHWYQVELDYELQTQF